MDPCLLDTNVLESLFKANNPEIVRKAKEHRSLYGTLHISIVTYYEVIRGHKYAELLSANAKRSARKRQEKFQEFCYGNKVLGLSEHACRKAAEAYAYLKRNNFQFEKESDILIAGIALANGMTVVTFNTKDFEHIPGLTIDDWQ